MALGVQDRKRRRDREGLCLLRSSTGSTFTMCPCVFVCIGGGGGNGGVVCY